MKSLVIKEKDAPNSLAVAISYNNIGLVYKNQGNLDKALEYYMKALVIQEKDAPNSLAVSRSYNIWFSV